MRAGEAFGGDQLSGFPERFVEAYHERDVRLDVLLRPRAKRVITRFRAVHHQNIFHVFAPFDLRTGLCTFMR